MNAVIREDTHLQEEKHKLKGYKRSHKAHLAKFFLAHSFIIHL